MKLKLLSVACLLLSCVVVGSALAQNKAADPISGTWTGDWGPSASDRNEVTVDFKFDGKALTGTVNPGPNAIPVQKGTFDPNTGAVHLEADAKNARGGGVIHYVIDGKLDKNIITGSWNHDNRKGDFKITKK